ncbi:2S seed storage protein 5 [Linum perenne]
MAKLMISVALLLLMAVASEASVRTTVIIDEAEDINQGYSSRGSCMQQLQEQGYLNHCQQYLIQEAVPSGGRGWSRETWGRQDPQGKFNMCCNQLRRMDRECTCLGLERAVQTLLQQHQRGYQSTRGTLDIQSALRLAETLPGKCVTTPSSCKITIRGSALS